jgi:hypothetical protein
MDVKGAQALRDRLEAAAAERQLAEQLARIVREPVDEARKGDAPDGERAA